MLLFDADAHYYEPLDCFERYVDPSLRHLAITADESGAINYGGDPGKGTAAHFMGELVAKPGGLKELFRAKGAGDRTLIPNEPVFSNRDARIDMLDELGFQAQLLYPTTACLVWAELGDNRDKIVANFGAFNRWLEEDWGFAYQNRLFAAPLISFVDRDFAVQQIDWALAQGAKAFCIPPGPAHGRNPADPYFDPIWARLNESGALVVLHVGESGYVERLSEPWGEDGAAPPFMRSTFQWVNFYNDRPIMEMTSALILGNLFERFPKLQVASIENGSMWVSYILKLMDKKLNIGALGPWIGGRVTEKPSVIFKRHFSVAPFPEENWPELIDFLGADRVLFGSDFPHPEGMVTPADWAELLPGVDDASLAQVMGKNAAALVGLGS